MNTQSSIINQQNKSHQENIFLIEQTGKKWKFLKILAILVVCIGITIFLWQLWEVVYKPIIENGWINNKTPLSTISLLIVKPFSILSIVLISTGFIVGAYAKLMAWWRHG